jgi:hypothetical protein
MPNLTTNLALVSEVEDHDPSDVAKVAAALQRQATRDFGPIWDMCATVDAFPRLEDVPIGYWPMMIRDDIGFEGAAGIHLDKDGQPFALITYGDSWSLTASHEMLEMLADPSGNRVIPGRSPKRGQGRVEFLVEVCDPSEAAEFGYTVNDILVSDFYTPRFFEPRKADGVRYSFTGAIKRPREVLRGGYLSWHDPVSDHWWQQVWFGQRKEYRDLGVFEASMESLRAEIDKRTPHPELVKGLRKSDKTLKAAVSVGKETEEAAGSKAATWRRQIAAIRDTAAGEG